MKCPYCGREIGNAAKCPKCYAAIPTKDKTEEKPKKNPSKEK